MSILRNFPSQTHRVTVTWNSIKKNWVIGTVNKFVLALFIISVLVIVIRWPLLPPMVPFWFSRPWGQDQLASPFWLILLPVSSLAWYGINVLVSVYITNEYLIFTQMLFISSLIVNLLSFLTLIKIIFLIT